MIFAPPSNNRRVLLILVLRGCALKQAVSLTGAASSGVAYLVSKGDKFPVIPCSKVIREFIFKILKTKEYRCLNSM
jgi:hypothetical protein